MSGRCHVLLAAALAAALLHAPARARAGTAEDFEALYGKDVKRALATPAKDDDVALAGQLLKAAQARSVPWSMRVLMWQKAVELGEPSPAGWDTAAEALTYLARASRHLRSDCLEKLTVIRQKQYSLSRGDDRKRCGEALIDCLLEAAEDREGAGKLADGVTLCGQAKVVAKATNSWKADFIDSRLERLAWRQGVLRRIEMHQRHLQANEFDADARRALILLYVVDRDDPAAAVPLLTADLEADLRGRVLLAGQRSGSRPTDDEDLSLGEWYRDLAVNADHWAQGAMLRRAERYYKRFLSKHTEHDLRTTKAQMDLQKVLADLAKLEQGGLSNLKPGLAAAFYALRAPDRLPGFGGMTPFSSGVAATIDHGSGKYEKGRDAPALRLPDPPRGHGAALGAVFAGYLKVKDAGDYTFYVFAEDGWALEVAGREVVSQEAPGPAQERFGKVKLAAGVHPIRLRCFDRDEHRIVRLSWGSLGFAKQIVPPAVLFHVPGN